MIVKLILHKDKKAFSVWNKEGARLFYSDKEKDLELCKTLLTVIKAKTDKEILEEKLSNIKAPIQTELKSHSYFMATWRKGIVTMTKRVSAYDW